MDFHTDRFERVAEQAVDVVEVAPRLSAVMPLTMVVYLVYAVATTAQPKYFFKDLHFALLSYSLRPGACFNPCRPRYNALPTGGTSITKSLAYNSCCGMCFSCLLGKICGHLRVAKKVTCTPTDHAGSLTKWCEKPLGASLSSDQKL